MAKCLITTCFKLEARLEQVYVYKEATGIANLMLHCFRHTYAANLVEIGIDTLLVRSLTGHSSERVFQRYIEGKRLAAAPEGLSSSDQ